MSGKTFIPIKLKDVSYDLVDESKPKLQEDRFIKLTTTSLRKNLSAVFICRGTSKSIYTSSVPKIQMMAPCLFAKTNKAVCKVDFYNEDIANATRVIIDSKMQFETVVLTETPFLVFKTYENNEGTFAFEATYMQELVEPNHRYFDVEDYECTKCSEFSVMLFFDGETKQYCPECA